MRFRWILKEGNDLFVVTNQGWEKLERFLPAFDGGTVKFQYTLRF